MTSSPEPTETEAVLKRLIAELNDEVLAERIDRPIQQALRTFHFERMEKFSQRQFHTVLADFVCHVYKNGLPLSQCLPEPLCLTEAIAWVEELYRNEYAAGYDAAIVEASESSASGIEPILEQLVDALIAAERRKHLSWIFRRYFHAADWQARCEVVRLFLERHGRHFSPSLRNCSPSQLVDEFPELLCAYLETDALLQQSCRTVFPDPLKRTLSRFRFDSGNKVRECLRPAPPLDQAGAGRQVH